MGTYITTQHSQTFSLVSAIFNNNPWTNEKKHFQFLIEERVPAQVSGGHRSWCVCNWKNGLGFTLFPFPFFCGFDKNCGNLSDKTVSSISWKMYPLPWSDPVFRHPLFTVSEVVIFTCALNDYFWNSEAVIALLFSVCALFCFVVHFWCYIWSWCLIGSVGSHVWVADKQGSVLDANIVSVGSRLAKGFTEWVKQWSSFPSVSSLLPAVIAVSFELKHFREHFLPNLLHSLTVPGTCFGCILFYTHFSIMKVGSRDTSHTRLLFYDGCWAPKRKTQVKNPNRALFMISIFRLLSWQPRTSHNILR